MGQPMDANLDDLSPTPSENRKGLVGDSKTDGNGVSRVARGMNWTEILRNSNLETPGYHETVLQMKKDGRIKGY